MAAQMVAHSRPAGMRLFNRASSATTETIPTRTTARSAAPPQHAETGSFKKAKRATTRTVQTAIPATLTARCLSAETALFSLVRTATTQMCSPKPALTAFLPAPPALRVVRSRQSREGTAAMACSTLKRPVTMRIGWWTRAPMANVTVRFAVLSAIESQGWWHFVGMAPSRRRRLVMMGMWTQRMAAEMTAG